MKKQGIYIVIFIVGFAAGLMIGINRANRYSMSIVQDPRAIRGFHGVAIFRIDKMTGKVEGTAVDAPQWIEIGIKYEQMGIDLWKEGMEFEDGKLYRKGSKIYQYSKEKEAFKPVHYYDDYNLIHARLYELEENKE